MVEEKAFLPIRNNLEQARQAIIEQDCKKASSLLEPLLNEKKFRVHLYYGVAKIMCEEYPAAYRSLQKALGYAPNQLWTARIFAMNGFIFYLIGKEKEAEFYFKLSREAYPQNELALMFGQRKLNKQTGIKTIIEWLK